MVYSLVILLIGKSNLLPLASIDYCKKYGFTFCTDTIKYLVLCFSWAVSQYVEWIMFNFIAVISVCIAQWLKCRLNFWSKFNAIKINITLRLVCILRRNAIEIVTQINKKICMVGQNPSYLVINMLAVRFFFRITQEIYIE